MICSINIRVVCAASASTYSVQCAANQMTQAETVYSRPLLSALPTPYIFYQHPQTFFSPSPRVRLMARTSIEVA